MRFLLFFLLHTVTLNWTASTTVSPTVTYNVYRGPAACSLAPVMTQIQSGISGLTATDSGVSDGVYCYAVTAQNSNGESVKDFLTVTVITPTLQWGGSASH